MENVLFFRFRFRFRRLAVVAHLVSQTRNQITQYVPLSGRLNVEHLSQRLVGQLSLFLLGRRHNNVQETVAQALPLPPHYDLANFANRYVLSGGED